MASADRERTHDAKAQSSKDESIQFEPSSCYSRVSAANPFSPIVRQYPPFSFIEHRYVPKTVLRSAPPLLQALEPIVALISHPALNSIRYGTLAEIRQGIQSFFNVLMNRVTLIPQSRSIQDLYLYINTAIRFKAELLDIFAIMDPQRLQAESHDAEDKSHPREEHPENSDRQHHNGSPHGSLAHGPTMSTSSKIWANEASSCLATLDLILHVLLGRCSQILNRQVRLHIFMPYFHTGDKSWDRQRQLTFAVEAPSAPLVCWNVFLKGIWSDSCVRTKVPPILMTRVFSHTLLNTACSFFARVLKIFPSRCRSDQFKLDLLFVVGVMRSFIQCLDQLHIAAAHKLEEDPTARATVEKLLPPIFFRPDLSVLVHILNVLCCKFLVLYAVLCAPASAIIETLDALARREQPSDLAVPGSAPSLPDPDSKEAPSLSIQSGPSTPLLSFVSDFHFIWNTCAFAAGTHNPLDPLSAVGSIGKPTESVASDISDIATMVPILLRASSKQSAFPWSSSLSKALALPCISLMDWLSFVAKRTDLRPSDQPPLSDEEKEAAAEIQSRVGALLEQLARSAV